MIRDDELVYRGFGVRLRVQFERFHRMNPQVFQMFKMLARQMQATGRVRYSGKNIAEKMRWDYNIATRGDVFKFNNNFIAIYVRLLIHRYPKEFVGFFQLRRVGPRWGFSDEDLEAYATKREEDDDL